MVYSISYDKLHVKFKVSFHDIFKKTLNITPVNVTSFTVLGKCHHIIVTVEVCHTLLKSFFYDHALAIHI